MGGDQTDFFVSHAGADRAWAEWVAWQLAEAGYGVELDVWDWAPGRNFVTAMSDGLDRAVRVVALLSAAYFDRSRYTTEEWSAAVLHVPGMEDGRLVPVRVEDVPPAQMPSVLRTLIFCDVFGVDADQARRVLLAAVQGPRRQDGRWLLVFDNAADPGDLIGWLPGGSGHVLITSREGGWAEIAVPVEVDVLARSESVAILAGRVPGLTGPDADGLAAELGDLPLAVAQAAGYLAETGMPAAGYLGLLKARAGQILGQGRPVSYPRSLAAATELIADQLARDDPAAAELASVCAFLAPEPIPEDLLTVAARELPASLAERVADPMAWHQTLAHISKQSLARIDHRGLQMHRLTQAILRDRLTPEQATDIRARAEAILAASNPRDPANPVTWPVWARLMPHLLAADLAATTSPGLRGLACYACWYLLARGDTRTAHDLATQLYQPWRDQLDGDDQQVLALAHYRAWALRNMGRYADARDLNQDTLDRYRRILGEDHPNTLTSASNLAIVLHVLGDVQGARDLDQDTLDRRRRILGDDHPNTLTSASNLASDLRALGEADD